jgi:hypothetical protein
MAEVAFDGPRQVNWIFRPDYKPPLAFDNRVFERIARRHCKVTAEAVPCFLRRNAPPLEVRLKHFPGIDPDSELAAKSPKRLDGERPTHCFE